jgi:murein DD-endopeptidase MepM/ murein hydrolase activator NlpD
MDCLCTSEKVVVTRGQRVSRGARLGEVGLFPASGGVPHVHWQLCRAARCYWGAIDDPLKITVGCYASDGNYPENRLLLTYPVSCR